MAARRLAKEIDLWPRPGRKYRPAALQTARGIGRVLLTMALRLVSLQGRMALWMGCMAMLGMGIYLALTVWPLPHLLTEVIASLGGDPSSVDWLQRPVGGVLATALLVVPLSLWLGYRVVKPLSRLLRALEGGVASYRDGDFSFSIATGRNDELGDLVRMHNQLGHTLREQRQHLVQRELLLDTVVQNTPVALLLVDRSERVAYANIAARHLLNDGRSLAGLAFQQVLDSMPEAMRVVISAGEDTLFSLDSEGLEETFHVSQRGFRLQGRPHRLYLFRRMTRELARQEVTTWKRVIRVISHELNNSLAPISSMAHSGAELARRGEMERLQGVFGTISERVRHLHHFISGYANVAKLPAPRPEPVHWQAFADGLLRHGSFRLQAPVPADTAHFDAGQIEQVLINLIKNAHESGSAADEIVLHIQRGFREWRIDVLDRGPGMSDAVLSQALLPFYSTKRSGTGLGLALAREIVEAHGGRLALANRDDGGLRVTLVLPERSI